MAQLTSRKRADVAARSLRGRSKAALGGAAWEGSAPPARAKSSAPRQDAEMKGQDADVAEGENFLSLDALGSVSRRASNQLRLTYPLKGQ